MNWYQGNISDAVQKSKEQNSIFVVFVEGKDELTQKLTQFINSERISVKLQSDDFLAIKIESDSETYMQFARIYQVVPVPSIFFIGKSGTPLEIGTGVIASADELEQKIDKVLAASGKSTSATSSFIAAEQQAAAVPPATQAKEEAVDAAKPAAAVDDEGDEIVCEGEVCFKKPKESPPKAKAAGDVEAQGEAVVAAEVKSPSTPVEAAAAPLEDGGAAAVGGDIAAADADSKRIEETRKLLEQKRRERVELEKKEKKERELQRRREGKDVQHLQNWQRETELKELKDSIRRNRLEEQAERERIRAQIAGDRAERATKSATEAEKAVANATSSPPQAKQQQPPSGDADTTRLQFRFSSGDNRSHTFNCLDTLGQVRAYVVSELLPGTGIRDFVLATTYPKRELAEEHNEQTLVELGLCPSAVILVIGKERSSSSPAAIIARSGGIVNVLSTIFWAVLSPVFAVFGYIKNIGNRRGAATDNDGSQKRTNEEQSAQHDAAKRRNLDRFIGPSTSKDASSQDADSPPAEETEPKPYRRYGGSNVHRLTDNRKDSDDENATWNGNSTQQQ